SRTLAPSDPRMAYQLSKSALALLRHGDARETELLKEITLLMHLAGDSDAARELADRAARALPVAEQAELALTVATMWSVADKVRLAASRGALELEGVPDALRAVHTAILSINLAVAGFLGEARVAAAEAGRMVQHVGSAEAAADALALSRIVL